MKVVVLLFQGNELTIPFTLVMKMVFFLQGGASEKPMEMVSYMCAADNPWHSVLAI